ncbi:hypothetical protein V6N13_123323 [Hibiscus sabdariffa]
MNKNKEEEKDQLICFECKKSGHIKVECPNLKKKSYDKKKHKSYVATWSDEETSDDEDYVANLCLMAIEDDFIVTSNSYISIDYTFDELQEAYDELVLVCEESMIKNRKTISKLKVENDSLSKTNKELESKIQELQVKLNDFEKKNKDLHDLLSRVCDDHQKKIVDLKASFNKVGTKIENGENSKSNYIKRNFNGYKHQSPQRSYNRNRARSI